MTANEVMLQKNEASPSVATSKDAIRSLISQDNARNAYFKQRAADYGKYIQNGGDPNRFESWYSTKFPLQAFAQNYAKSQPATPDEPVAAGKGPVKIASDAEFDALPKGAEFIGPDGKHRKKP
jgi:hypothetical protein